MPQDCLDTTYKARMVPFPAIWVADLAFLFLVHLAKIRVALLISPLSPAEQFYEWPCDKLLKSSSYCVVFMLSFQRKLEARTIAVVLDRLALVGFLVVIIIVIIVTVTLFLQNPGTSYVNCCE